MAMYFILRGDKQVGPGTDEQIINLIAKGKLAADSLLKSVESGETKEASQWPQFQMYFNKSDNYDFNNNPFDDNSTPKATKKSANTSKQTKAISQPEPNDVDYSNEPDFEEFIKKRQLFTILSYAEFCCCFANPKFVVGDINGAIIRMLLYIPLGVLCFASLIIKILEIIKLHKMTDNQFYATFKVNKKLFNI